MGRSKVVREGRFEAMIEALRIQFAQDAARSLSEYHIQFVVPAIELLRYLTLPWWKRLFTKRPDVDPFWYLNPVRPAEIEAMDYEPAGEPDEEPGEP